MNIDELTIGQLKEISKLINHTSPSEIESPFIGKNCVIRTYSAGVWIGKLEQQAGTEVVLTNALRLFEWNGAFTLSEVATKGVSDGTRIASPVEGVHLTEAIEIIPCTERAYETYKKFIE